MSDNRASQAFDKSLSLRTMEMKSKTRGGGRCCICFDPFYIQNVSVVVFFCCHGYHTTCLTDSYYTSNTKEVEDTPHETATYDDYNGYVDDASDENEETKSDSPRMRCVLCTTAAAG